MNDVWNILVNGIAFCMIYLGFAYLTKMHVIKDVLQLIKSKMEAKKKCVCRFNRISISTSIEYGRGII